MKRREVEMLWKPGKIELLAPARDLRSARAAIDCGADAVYMGGPRFGARQAAGNSVADIAAVAEYARRFGVRVYVTLNTLLFDDELADAERIARQVVEAGADALIVQDMAYLEMELEGVELHASTQTFNASPEKAAFLADCGFSRVILERNLSLEEIRRIRAATDVELECFVHGAICVCYSGRCYMSRTMSPRSGNRGDCMQACRLPYDLLDAAGNVLMAGKHLLSVRDMDLSGRLGDLLDAGVTSFKIEGRLKDEAYVRNVVAWYRTRLDREIAARPGLVRASEGQSDPGFEPDLARTFSRGRTEYFFDGRRAGVSTPDTPKAVGGFVCRVARSGPGWFEPQGGEAFAPGDGICFMYGGRLAGTNVNGTEGGRVQLNKEWKLLAGTEIYRNYDRRFSARLEGARARRSVRVSVTVSFDEGAVSAEFRDGDGFRCLRQRGGAGTGEGAGDAPYAACPVGRYHVRCGGGVFCGRYGGSAFRAGFRGERFATGGVGSVAASPDGAPDRETSGPGGCRMPLSVRYARGFGERNQPAGPQILRTCRRGGRCAGVRPAGRPAWSGGHADAVLCAARTRHVSERAAG